MVLGNTSWEGEPDARGTASDLRRQAGAFETGGLVGLATASMAISALAVLEPPPALDKNAYFIALTGSFFAGVAEVITAVSISSNSNPSVRRAAGRKLVYASIAPLAVVVCLSAASLLR